jgi:hypothetical protein
MKKTLLLFLMLYALCMFLSLNMNSKYRIHTYKSTMWADATGYYVYLPATFIYHWNFDAVSPGMDTLTGRGFELDKGKKVIYTKYTSGVSYLQLPFFGLAHLYCKLNNIRADGFSQPYVNSLLFSGVFYMLCALFLLFRFLNAFYSGTVSLITTVALPLCTNLYYYGIEHPGLSHVYTFFLCSALLYLLQYYNSRRLLLILPLGALIFVIRPTNIILLGMAAAFLVCTKDRQWFSKLNYRYILGGLLISLFIIVPQLFYWKYVSGNWVTYSYRGEGFIYWKSPKVPEVLFAACNGFLTYAPIMVFSFWGFYFRPVSKKFTLSILLLMALLVYTNASWWSWRFGCAYGGRAFIDYYVFFAIGLATFVNYVFTRPKAAKVLFMLLGALFVVYNILFVYGYDDCWYSTDWDYSYILTVLKG